MAEEDEELHFDPPSDSDEDDDAPEAEEVVPPAVEASNGATQRGTRVEEDDNYHDSMPLASVRWAANGASGVDFGVLEDHYARYAKAIGSFIPTGNAALDAARYVAFEGELADAVKALRDDDGEFAHPLAVHHSDRRGVRRYLHRLLKEKCGGGKAARFVETAAHGERAIAALRSAYDARHSARAKCRVATAAGEEVESPFAALVWDKHFQFTEPENNGLNPKYDIMEVKAKNGTIVRETSSMTSDLIAELPRGALVLVHRRALIKHNGKDVTRCGIARPVHGFVSAKMLQPTKRKPDREFFDPTPQDIEYQKKKAAGEAAGVVDVDPASSIDERGNE